MSEHTQKAIEDEAKKLYPDGGNFALLRRRGYIAGRSKSISRERELEEALREHQKFLYKKYPNIAVDNPDHMEAYTLYQNTKNILNKKS